MSSWKNWSTKDMQKRRRSIAPVRRASYERLLEVLLEQQVCCMCFEEMKLPAKLTVHTNEQTRRRALCHLSCLLQYKQVLRDGHAVPEGPQLDVEGYSKKIVDFRAET